MNRYLDTENSILEIQLHKDKIKEWFFPNDYCMSDLENYFEISGDTILYGKENNELEIKINIKKTNSVYFYKIVNTIERLLDAIAYNIISSNDEEQMARMQEFIKRFKEFNGE